MTKRSTHLSVWLIASIFYAYQYVLRVIPNILGTDMALRFQIDPAALSEFSGFYYIGYALMHIPVGLMIDRLGLKKTLPAFMLLTALGVYPLIYSRQWAYPLVGRLLTGAGSSAAILGILNIIRTSFVEKHFTRMLSFSLIIGLIGAIYGGKPLYLLNEQYGLDVVLKGIALTGVLLSAGAYLLIPRHQAIAQPAPIWADLKALMKHRKLLSLCLIAGLMVGPIEGFADAWVSQFLVKVYRFAPQAASALPSVIFVGMCLGGPVLSYLAERSHAYLRLVLASALIMALLFALLLTAHIPAAAMTPSLGLIGLLSAYQVLVMYKASTYVPLSQVTLATAVTNMIVMLFGYFFHTGIGHLVVHYTPPQLGLAEPNVFAYQMGLSIIPIALLLSAVLMGIFLKVYRET